MKTYIYLGKYRRGGKNAIQTNRNIYGNVPKRREDDSLRKKEKETVHDSDNEADKRKQYPNAFRKSGKRDSVSTDQID
ncbi:hypothetical protein CHS0354_037798 [Potamilus streckersoni]|uniref:Uncharacterized protein n=1 Tax=Potamilus streckersoni TaxID=2493646 RepID=A0AAE0SNH9_9BIVA|nr:hypothetical protein CHS0354_037798 [Potamilus streckersoni]